MKSREILFWSLCLLNCKFRYFVEKFRFLEYHCPYCIGVSELPTLAAIYSVPGFLVQLERFAKFFNSLRVFHFLSLFLAVCWNVTVSGSIVEKKRWTLNTQPYCLVFSFDAALILFNRARLHAGDCLEVDEGYLFFWEPQWVWPSNSIYTCCNSTHFFSISTPSI
jgi:hypothetical protein